MLEAKQIRSHANARFAPLTSLSGTHHSPPHRRLSMRKQSGMVLLLMSLLFLAGCGGNPSAPSAPSAHSSPTPSAHSSPTPAALTITEFPLLSNDSGPSGITAGPDGNLWFTQAGGKIGRITPAGNITEFPLPRSCENHPPSA